MTTIVIRIAVQLAVTTNNQGNTEWAGPTRAEIDPEVKHEHEVRNDVDGRHTNRAKTQLNWNLSGGVLEGEQCYAYKKGERLIASLLEAALGACDVPSTTRKR
jgi:hypothetical protein